MNEFSINENLQLAVIMIPRLLSKDTLLGFYSLKEKEEV